MLTMAAWKVLCDTSARTSGAPGAGDRAGAWRNQRHLRPMTASGAAGSWTRPGAADLLAWLGTTDFFEAPASTRFHGAYPGGLVEHSLNVYYALLGQSTIREYGGESIAVVALLHDVCKTGYYRRERDGKYSVKDQLPMGHGEKSVYLVMKFMDLTDEEALAIRWHMGAYDDAFRGGSRALNEAQDKCALVLALHHADMQATQEEKRREGIL